MGWFFLRLTKNEVEALERKDALKLKALSGQCSSEELQELFALISEMGTQRELESMMRAEWAVPAEDENLEPRTTTRLLSGIRQAILPVEVPEKSQTLWKALAILIFLLGLGFAVFSMK